MSPVDVAVVGRDLGMSAKRDLLIDAADRVGDVKTAFSSWDNCMKVGYCKWPVIAVIAVGSLILLSVVWCICFRCCGNCCGCCDAPNRRQQNYLEEPYIPPGHGYQTQPPMLASGAFPPQYAQFDVPRKGGADALPEMPSWESGNSKKVMVEDDEVEMNQLNNNNNKRVSSPLAQAPMAPSTISSTLVYTPGYSHQSPDVSYERGYFDHEPNNNAYGLAQPTPRSPSRPYNLMHQDTGDSFTRMGRQGPSPYPAARADYQYPPNSTPAPREPQDYASPGYGYDYPRAHSTSPPAEAWPASHQSPITNNAGFDFTSGYARPTNADADVNPRYPSPPTSSTPVYPGYKPYQPPSQPS
ncbi:hypothetical protein L249_3613 [Ophiocordyceps polyrhachis-furcata BCC 54312]|uniref:Fibroin-3 n=1 Tax=Ophiocordyceps polyrhachis-furcata BCC 54312 TaxID=1330021 RepID=A0A367LM97_9HYPO|nr:hypothetical protein L249_3613 [Ophiocordyceps polyrhachis-furcata BCC 54312]